MGNYISYQNVEDRIGSARLNALCNVADTTAKTALVNVIIGRAEALVDGFAAVRYSVPLPASLLVAEWALSIAEYELYKRGPGSQVPEKIKESYRNAIDLLTVFASGKLETGGQLGKKSENLPAAPIRVRAPKRKIPE